jgi:hypothetical protein
MRDGLPQGAQGQSAVASQIRELEIINHPKVCAIL